MQVKSGQAIRILVIDDNNDLTQSMKVLLEREGYGVELAPNGIRALELQRARAFDVIITDIFMPDMDGFETIIEFRRDFPSIKIIAMSSGGAHAKATDYLSTASIAGADATLRKPFQIESLLEVLRKLRDE